MAISNRKDILIENEPAVAEAVSKQIATKRRAKPSMRTSEAFIADKSRLVRVRRSFIEAETSDPNGYERVIGRSDFVSANFLARGIEAAKAVCRIRVPGVGGGWHATGFLVGPGLLMTNHHVLSNGDEAAQAEAEFGFEHDVEGVLAKPVQFNLNPKAVFFTDADYDVTLVAVAEFSDGGVPLDRYGYLPLLPVTGKGLENEWVTLPQHPGGQPKQMTVRASQIVELENVPGLTHPERFIHYSSDTEPGSSGAPVLNDQWQVLAIHHKAIPHPDNDKRIAKGKEPQWLANQGVRISAISGLLESQRFSHRGAAAAAERLDRGLGMPTRIATSAVEPANPEDEKDLKPHKTAKWDTWIQDFELGYKSDFLPVPLDIMTILDERAVEAAKLKNGDDIILDYLHFSSVVHKDRKFPMMTAVNIHGSQLKHPGDRSGRFRRDIRLDDEFQPAANFYEKKLGDDPVSFSRGHLVRRLDPCWGTVNEAKVADLHTFHYTNAAPQVQGFNAGDWLTIEDYILDRAQVKDKKMTVFTGPIFRDHDPEYGESRDGGSWRIPVTYWKVVVIEKPGNEIAATAFLQGQTKFVDALFEARVFTNLRKNTIGDLQADNLQTSIEIIEEETGLNFSMLRDHDISNALESTRRIRFLRSVEDIKL